MKVRIVVKNRVLDESPVLGVYNLECEIQAQAKADEWTNGSAGENAWSGRSIGPRHQYAERAWVEIHEVQES